MLSIKNYNIYGVLGLVWLSRKLKEKKKKAKLQALANISSTLHHDHIFTNFIKSSNIFLLRQLRKRTDIYSIFSTHRTEIPRKYEKSHFSISRIFSRTNRTTPNTKKKKSDRERERGLTGLEKIVLVNRRIAAAILVVPPVTEVGGESLVHILGAIVVAVEIEHFEFVSGRLRVGRPSHGSESGELGRRRQRNRVRDVRRGGK